MIIVVREVFFYEEEKPKTTGLPSLKYEHHLRYSLGYIEVESQKKQASFIEVKWLKHGKLDSAFIDILKDLLAERDHSTFMMGDS